MSAAAGLSSAVVALCVAAVAVTSCSATSPRAASTRTPSPVAHSDPADPTVLVGQWRVATAEGTGPDSWLRLGAELDVWSDCGHANGTWRAVGAAFLTSLYGSYFPQGSDGDPSACLDEARFGKPSESLRWLWSAASYEVREEGIALTDLGGDMVAMLVNDGSSPPAERVLDPSPPTLTPELADRLAAPAPLPSGTHPVEDLIGRWLPTDRTAQSEDAVVEFAAGGIWTGSDGCNGGNGRWVSGADGLLLATTGPQTLIGCDNSNAIGWLYGVTRAGLIGEELVMFDSAGERLGSFEREDPFGL